MSQLVIIPWYATIGRGDGFAAEVAAAAPVALRYGATRYSVQRSRDDRYKINQLSWFQTKRDWYRYWEGPEMIEFRRRNSGRFQIPVVYVWHDELSAGELGPQVQPEALPAQPEPEPQSGAAA